MNRNEKYVPQQRRTSVRPPVCPIHLPYEIALAIKPGGIVLRISLFRRRMCGLDSIISCTRVRVGGRRFIYLGRACSGQLTHNYPMGV
jgi:hypothetical protein